jgi:hypothetical protein
VDIWKTSLHADNVSSYDCVTVDRTGVRFRTVKPEACSWIPSDSRLAVSLCKENSQSWTCASLPNNKRTASKCCLNKKLGMLMRAVFSTWMYSVGEMQCSFMLKCWCMYELQCLKMLRGEEIAHVKCCRQMFRRNLKSDEDKSGSRNRTTDYKYSWSVNLFSLSVVFHGICHRLLLVRCRSVLFWVIDEKWGGTQAESVWEYGAEENIWA